MAATSAVIAAILAALSADTGSGGLLMLMPDGVFFGIAPPGLRSFVLVSLVSSQDEEMFSGRAHESHLVLVKAVDLNTDPANALAAADRIDVVLDEASLSATGYGMVSIARESRVQDVEVDDSDPDIRWQHAGGMYDVFASA